MWVRAGPAGTLVAGTLVAMGTPGAEDRARRVRDAVATANSRTVAIASLTVPSASTSYGFPTTTIRRSPTLWFSPGTPWEGRRSSSPTWATTAWWRRAGVRRFSSHLRAWWVTRATGAGGIRAARTWIFTMRCSISSLPSSASTRNGSSPRGSVSERCSLSISLVRRTAGFEPSRPRRGAPSVVAAAARDRWPHSASLEWTTLCSMGIEVRCRASSSATAARSPWKWKRAGVMGSTKTRCRAPVGNTKAATPAIRSSSASSTRVTFSRQTRARRLGSSFRSSERVVFGDGSPWCPGLLTQVS